jgi:hypothetical protein
MTKLREHLEMRRTAFGANLPNDFLLTYGRDYPVGPDTFAGPRGEQHGCFMNACHRAVFDKRLTYVEGYVTIYGVPVQHAWCVDADGFVVETTITNKGQVGDYYGVPFNTDYVEKAAKTNGIYGLLDYFYSGKTAPKLFELGLEAGQQWLLDQPEKVKRKRRSRAACWLALMLLGGAMIDHARAEERTTFRDANGREVGSATSDGRNTVYRDASGRNTGRSYSEGGKTIILNNMGQRTGTSSGRGK